METEGEPANDAAGEQPKRKKSASTAEVSERVAEILRIRLDGAEFHDIEAYAASKGWNVSSRQLWRYIEKADGLLLERQDRKRRRLLARHIAQRQALYARAVNAADNRTALAILADLAKLQGLYASDKELKELARILAEQSEQLKRLEEAANAARGSEEPVPSQPAKDEQPESEPTG